ncbi:MAG: GNAT family N-acetyltransferase [Paludibacteraceae bacterium]|nr:GNAT family N-acetyltransferase [Paludibacteraceae bacterium]
MTYIRKIQPQEIPVLDDFLYEAIFIPQGVVPPPRSIIEQEDLQVYVRGFGDDPHDHCLVAEVDGKIAGAVWVRIMDDYGHVDDQTPSLAISLYPEYRGQGIGTQLLNQMLNMLRQKGYPQVSLSVQKENYALRMYQKAGFETVEDRGDEVLMVRRMR